MLEIILIVTFVTINRLINHLQSYKNSNIVHWQNSFRATSKQHSRYSWLMKNQQESNLMDRLLQVTLWYFCWYFNTEMKIIQWISCWSLIIPSIWTASNATCVAISELYRMTAAQSYMHNIITADTFNTCTWANNSPYLHSIIILNYNKPFIFGKKTN